MKLLFSFLIAFSLTANVFAQEEKSKKVIIIETEEENAAEKGQEEKYIEVEVEASDEEIEKMDEENVLVVKKKKEEKIEKEIMKDGEDGEIKYKYKIVSEGEDGTKEVMEWEGTDESEMPKELKEKIEKMEAHGAHEKMVKKEKSKVKIKVKKDGEEQEFEFESNDGKIEIPEELKAELERLGVDAKIMEIESEHEEKNKNKAQLGVMIANHENGVLVNDTIEGSSAAEGGILSGDIIQAIDGTAVGSIEELVGAIGNYGAGDEINVSFLREGTKMEKRFVLQERAPATWKEATRDK